MIDVFGTLGPSCDDVQILTDMFAAGMTGIRINLSHVMLTDCIGSIEKIQKAAAVCDKVPKILIDMQGPELRIGRFKGCIELSEGSTVSFGVHGIPLDSKILESLSIGDEVLLDDGKILGKVIDNKENDVCLKILRGGKLTQRKSIAITGKELKLPAVTQDDIENIKVASKLGITGIMQPFVRSSDDLVLVRKVLDENGCEDIKIYAKIENASGVKNIVSFLDLCDEVIIARGDLGNSMPLWELPHTQKYISKICNDHDKPFMVVTQMLSSMEKSAVPTRAEVSDIYNAVLDGAYSVMVTGETAIGEYPVEVIRYLYNTAQEALKHMGD